MLELKLDIDLSQMQTAIKDLSDGVLPLTAQAIHTGTRLIQKTWIQAASGREVTYQGRTFTVKRVSGSYARSIEHGLTYPDGGDELSGRVTADAVQAEAIESGSPPRDMKPGLLSGPKARRSKDGGLYTIVPFQHGTPTAKTLGETMPKELYDQAKRFSYSQVIGHRTEANAFGVPTRRNVYRWGQRGGNTDIGWRSRTQPEGHEYTHTTSIFSGMVKMGQARHSSFMTFRVVSSKSPSNSWWSPGVEPRPVAAAVAAMCEETIFTMVRSAFAQDIANALGGTE